MVDTVAPASTIVSAGGGRITSELSRPRRRGSLVTHYFLVILFIFGCVQFYFNIQQDDFHHQSYHIAAFQRKHFIKSNSKARKEYLAGKTKNKGAADATDVNVAVAKGNYREGDERKYSLAGLSCERFGGPSDEDAAEMVFWEDIPSDSLHVSPFHKPNQKQYLTFTADHGEWESLFTFCLCCCSS
jgi:hypothetical protein